MRDALKPQASALDFVRNSRGANRLTRPIDLVRNWTYVTDLSLQTDHLVWREAERIHVGDWWLLDGAIARRAIVARQNAEKKGRGILDELLRLCDARDQAILDYAQTWGVLELCSHKLPARHEFSMHVPLRLPAPLAVPSSSDPLNPTNLRACLPSRKEPLFHLALLLSSMQGTIEHCWRASESSTWSRGRLEQSPTPWNSSRTIAWRRETLPPRRG